MWNTKTEEIEPGKVQKYKLFDDDRLLTYAEVVNLWQSNKSFREVFIGLLRDSSFTSYFWETPPVTASTWEQPFEFVLVNSPSLARLQPEPDAFKEHFNKDLDGNGIVSFPNLGGDATMVVPCPVGPNEAYAHLAAFIRNGPEDQIHALWELVGYAVGYKVNDRPTWLSTAGFGVYWLHVRLDSRPKYYRYQPYKTAF